VRQRQHGTLACYRWGVDYGTPDWRNGCRCPECRTAVKVYEIKRLRRRASGQDFLIDATEARDHIAWLRSQGVGLRTIAAEVGMKRLSVSRIADGTCRRAKRNNVAAILAVGTHKRAAGALVDARPTWQLIDEMIAHGHTKTRIAAELGSKAARPALHLQRDRITQAKADAVQEVYDRLMVRVIARREWDARRQREYRKRVSEAAG